jgi:general secretion pathway protein D
MIKFQAIARQNAIVVVSRTPELLRTPSASTNRLDSSNIASTGIKVYRLRYGDAKQIAGLLNNMFGGKTADGLDSASNQLIPGSGATTFSSGTGGGEFNGQATLSSTFKWAGTIGCCGWESV